MRIRHLLYVTSVALLLAACSPRQAHQRQSSETPEANLLRADALVQQGCYLCLGDALSIYRELLAARFQPALTGERAYRTATLMAVREREVGIVPAEPANSADAKGERTAGMAPYGEMAAAIPWSGSAFPEVDRAAVMPRLPAWRAQLAPVADGGDPFAAYLLVALSCSYATTSSPAANVGRYPAAHPGFLGLTFRAAICRPVDEAALGEVVRREPRFVEADFLLGQACARRREVSEAERRYRRVAEALPQLVGAPVALGNLLADGEEFETALDSYARALNIMAEHRQALLGRIRCLSNLERHHEALDACDTVIRLGTWYLGPAHYWRAWNLYALHDLTQAWTAIQAARQYLQTADVFDLSGVIAFDRQDFSEARADLQEALRRDKSMCRPRFYLGRVQAGAGEWAAAAGSFEQGVTCYGAGAGATALRIEETRRSALPEPRKARLLDRLERQMTASEHASALSAYHAAVSYANAGMIEPAVAQAERALRDGQLKVQAAELLAKLRKEGR